MGLEGRIGPVGKVDEGPDQYVVWGRGKQLQAGDPAPDFAVDILDLRSGDLDIIRLENLQDKITILHLTPGANHSTSNSSTPELDLSRSILGPENSSVITTLTVTLDLPYALAYWSRDKRINHRVASASSSGNTLGLDYKALIRKPYRALQEAIFVISNGVIQYSRYTGHMLVKRIDFLDPMQVAMEHAQNRLWAQSTANILSEFSAPTKPVQGS